MPCPANRVQENPVSASHFRRQLLQSRTRVVCGLDECGATVTTEQFRGANGTHAAFMRLFVEEGLF